VPPGRASSYSMRSVVEAKSVGGLSAIRCPFTTTVA
jgi:hypothetical protein